MAKIGIDFGTTNSLVVAYDRTTNSFIYFKRIYDEDIQANKPVPTSSTVWYNGQEVVIGSEARKNIHTYSGRNGHHFEKSIKLKLGKDIDVNVFGNILKPYEIAGHILSELKKVALKDGATQADVDLNRAVFTVPVDFDGRKRSSLREAAREAGIEVTTFIHEPFAAIVGYFFTKDSANSFADVIKDLNSLKEKHLLVFDWGGGTLDITVIKVDDKTMIEKGTAELTDEAGDKFDEDIADWAWNKFYDQAGSDYDHVYLEKIRKDNWDRILAEAEGCKIRLTKDDETDFFVTDIIEGVDIDLMINRKDFEALINKTLLKALNEIDNAIRSAGIGSEKIHQVLLTGGTCFIPAVQDKLRERFGHRVVTPNNSDLLIAQGAAVISEMGWLPFLSKNISIKLSDDSLYAVFEKGRDIIAGEDLKNSEDLVCSDNRGGDAKIIIVEGKKNDNDVRILEVMKVPVLNHSKFNDDIKFDAVIDKNIVLKIAARSLMVKGFDEHKENYTVKKEAEVNQLCFGLNFKE